MGLCNCSQELPLFDASAGMVGKQGSRFRAGFRKSQLGGASDSGATAHLRFHLTLDEREQIGVDLFGLGDGYAVSTTGINLQNRVRDDRWHAAAGWTDRHDLVVFAVNDK